MEKNVIFRIRHDVEKCIGRNVMLRANKGRKRIITRRGVVEAVYPDIFVVRLDKDGDTSRTVSYTYSDVLTRTVEITLLKAEVESDVKIS